MRKILGALKQVWFLNFVRRLYRASVFYNRKYFKILKWGFTSNEDTNFTYELTDDSKKYLAHSIALVLGKEYSEITGYIKEVESNEDLKEHIVSAIANSKEGKFADKEIRFGRRIGWYAFVRSLKPKVIIETGVDKGMGSVLLCAALEKNDQEGYTGKFYGTDINPKAGYLLSGRYKKFGEILYGDSIETLSNFKDSIDIFINDSDHSAEYEYNEYKTIEPLLKENTIILGDNSHCTDKLSKFSIEKGRQFIFFKEEPLNHWYPGAGIGMSFNK